MSKIVKLSASRVKTARSCSWLYWAKYHMMLPDKKNDGSSRGDICHAVFECLGKANRKRYYNKIIKNKDSFCVPSIKRMVLKKAIGHGVNDEENLTMINDMIVAGLEYDFYGKDLQKPTEAYSEYEFDLKIEEQGKQYHIKGFIDKLFLYKSKKLAVIRDFKTSKAVFQGKEVSENLQDYIYCLAVKHLFPEYKERRIEFVFLKFDLKNSKNPEGLLKMEKIPSDDLEKFELNLGEAQRDLEKFNKVRAKKSYAADKKVTKEDGFAGPIMCGFARYRGQPKKNGQPMWHCMYKFPFEYYTLYNDSGKLIKKVFAEDYFELVKLQKEGYTIEKERYQGCPRWNRTDY